MSKKEKYEKLLTNVNVVATLHMINQVESNYGSDSYNVIFGGSKVNLTSDHPRISVCAEGLCSDAAGRYQFMSFSWDEVNSEIGPLDFSNPRHQDIAAVARMDFRGVLEDVIKGDIYKALTGGYPEDWTHDSNGVCGMSHSGLACEWAGLAPHRYEGQGDYTIQQHLSDFEKFKGIPLPQGGVTLVEGNIGSGVQTAMQAFSASLEYGASSIVGFIGNTKRSILSHQMRICKVEGGHPLSGVKKVMGGEGSMKGTIAGYTPGMNNSTVQSELKPGTFTPRPGAYINPAPGVPVNSPYGWRGWRMHHGTDQAADEGTPILASGEGIVNFVGWDGGYGNAIKIKHSDGLTTTYNHLLDGSTKVIVGQKVKQGDVIAEMGTTGFSTGPHLHFEFWRGDGVARDESIDPQSIIPDLI